jgi:hypothetical protein
MQTKYGYYLPISEANVADWRKYREKLVAYRGALRDFAAEIGAEKVFTGFAGGICGATFKDDTGLPHTRPEFSKQTNKRGYHPVLSRGRSEEQKAAIKEFNERNEAISALRPDPKKVAVKHGFILSFSYKTERGEGHYNIGDPFNPVQAAWFDPDGVIMVYAPDANEAIKTQREDNKRAAERWPDTYSPITEMTPEYWCVPDGYERITEAKWNAMLWAYKDKMEQEGKDDE